MQSAPINGPAVLLITLGLLSTSCAAAPSVQTRDDPISASRVEAEAPADRKTTEAASIIPSTSHITYRPGWLVGGPLTPDGAQAQVRTFLGEPAAVLEGYFVDEAAPGVASGGRTVVSLSNRKLFKIQRPVAGAAMPDEFTVDVSSGEVVEALLHSHAIHDASPRRMTEIQAKEIAEEFGRSHFADFDLLSLYESGALGIAHDGVPTYIVRWARRAESGAWLPTGLQIGIDLQTGQVVTYYAQRVDYRGPTIPSISRERAIELALAEARKDARLASAKAGRVELTTIHLAFSEWRLAWSVNLEGVPPGVTVRPFSVDALTGAILNPLDGPVG